MRILIETEIPTEAGNNFVKNPSFGEKLQAIFQEQKAEAVYFHPRNGQRGITYVAQISDGSKIPWLLEPWWVLEGGLRFYSRSLECLRTRPISPTARAVRPKRAFLGR